MAQGCGGSSSSARNSQVNILAGIQEVFGAFHELSILNPNQGPGFVIRHLSKIFVEDTSKNNDAQPEEREPEEEEQSKTFRKIGTLYRVFKTLSKWDPEGAPELLIKNLREILLKQFPLFLQSSPVDLDPANKKEPEEEKEEDEDDVAPILDEEKTTSIVIDDDSGDQYATDDLPQNETSDQSTLFCEDKPTAGEAIEEASSQIFACTFCPRQFDDEHEWLIHTDFHRRRSRPISTFPPSIFCQYCKRTFLQAYSKDFHEQTCRAKSKFKAGTSILLQKLTSGQSTPSETSEMPTCSTSRQIAPPLPRKMGVVRGLFDVSRIVAMATIATLKSCRVAFPFLNQEQDSSNSRFLECPFCHVKRFSSAVFLANHIRTHTMEKPFTCPHPGCPKLWSDSLNFTKHVKLPHDKTGRIIPRHVREGRPSRNHKTKNPGPGSRPKSKVGFASTIRRINSAVVGQRIRRLSGPQRSCPYCEKAFPNRRDLERHIRVHTGEKPFSCSFCFRKFTQKGSAAKHIQGHYQRGETTESLSVIEELESAPLIPCYGQTEEEQQQQQEQVYPEDGCETRPEIEWREVQNWEEPRGVNVDIDVEVEVTTGAAKGPYPASDSDDEPVCVYDNNASRNLVVASSSSPSLLPSIPVLSPFYIKDGPKRPRKYPYECRICRKMFVTSSGLKTHFLVHSGQRPFPCRHCDVKFKQIGHRQAHEKLQHTRQGLLSCQLCERQLLNVSSLREHIATVHNGESPFFCRYNCGEAFRSRWSRRTHEKEHTARKSEPLDTC